MSNATEIRKESWGQIKQILYHTKKKDIVIWTTDSNGQVSRNAENKDKTIGRWTTDNENITGNGGKFPKQCRGNILFITNTLFFAEKEILKTS